MYLLDTNVVSELRKVRGGKGHAAVAAWSETVDARDLYLSVVTLYELEIGVLRLERSDPERGALLREWLQRQVETGFRGRMLSVDARTAQRSAVLQLQRTRPALDSLIAATAYVHGMSVVTRNVADFADAGVVVLNPFEFARKESRH